MADSVVVFDDGHAGELGDGLNKFLSATWDNEVDVLIHFGHGANCSAVSQINDLYRIGGDAGLNTALAQSFGNRQI